MSMSRCQNLLRPLECVTASYHDAAAWSRSNCTATIEQRASQLAAYMDLSLDEPWVAQSLHDATAELHNGAGLAVVLPKVLEGAMSLAGAEAGNIQIVDPGDDSLVLVTQLGFDHAYLDHFAVVHDGHSVCGRAASQGAQAVVADVQHDPALTPHKRVFRAAGVRAIQSTPMFDHTGRMIGVISTHLSRPGRPTDRALQIMGLYSQFSGEIIARCLGRISPDHPRNPAPKDALAASPKDALAASPESAIVQRLADTINRIFSAGLSLAGAQSLITDDLAAQRMRSSITNLDDTIRTIQLAILDLASPATTTSSSPETAEE